jgi:hypothetical protein
MGQVEGVQDRMVGAGRPTSGPAKDQADRVCLVDPRGLASPSVDQAVAIRLRRRCRLCRALHAAA